MKIIPGTYAGVQLDATQAGWAQQVVDACFAYPGSTDRDAVAALTCVAQESNFYMYANDGTSVTLTAEQKAAIRKSLELPYDKVGSNSASVGLYQQQPYIPGRSWGWGTIAECMDPVFSTKSFLTVLSKIPDRVSKPVGVLVQAVQRSAYPDAYTKWEPLATELVGYARATPPSDLKLVFDMLNVLKTQQNQIIASQDSLKMLLQEIRNVFK